MPPPGTVYSRPHIRFYDYTPSPAIYKYVRPDPPITLPEYIFKEIYVPPLKKPETDAGDSDLPQVPPQPSEKPVCTDKVAAENEVIIEVDVFHEIDMFVLPSLWSRKRFQFTDRRVASAPELLIKEEAFVEDTVESDTVENTVESDTAKSDTVESDAVESDTVESDTADSAKVSSHSSETLPYIDSTDYLRKFPSAPELSIKEVCVESDDYDFYRCRQIWRARKRRMERKKMQPSETFPRTDTILAAPEVSIEEVCVKNDIVDLSDVSSHSSEKFLSTDITEASSELSIKEIASPITFITKYDEEKYSQMEWHWEKDIKYKIIDADLFIKHDYQGPEAYALKAKIMDAISIPYFSCPIVVDMTSLCFNALGGLPGTLTTSFVNILTSEELYKLLDGFDDKSAYVMYSVGVLEDIDSEVHVIQSRLSGTMVKPKDPNASGWEVCFQPDGYDIPYAELPKDVLKRISERRGALRTLRTFFLAKEGVNIEKLMKADEDIPPPPASRILEDDYEDMKNLLESVYRRYFPHGKL